MQMLLCVRIMKRIFLIIAVISTLFCISGCSSNRADGDIGSVLGTSGLPATSQTEEQDDMYSVILDINGREFPARLYRSKTAEELIKRFPLTLDMSDLNGNEKYNYFDFSLTQNNEAVGRVNKGDIMLYGDNCLVLFYDSFDTSYSYTTLGYIENPEETDYISGAENVTICFKLKD